MKNFQFIVLAPNNWFGQWMNRQQLFSRIGKKHKVIYSNGPLHSWQKSSETYKTAPMLYTTESANNISVLKPSRLFARIARLGFFDRFALKRFVSAVEKPLDQEQPTCLYVFHPKYAEYIEHIPHDILVYHAYDDYSKQASYGKVERTAEEKLVSKADCIFASSRMIQKRLSELVDGAAVDFLPNGVDYQHFATAKPQPSELKSIQHPQIGYVGSVNDKVDLNLLKDLAERKPDYQFIIIGGFGRFDDQDGLLNSLQQTENVHFLGSKSVDEIAGFMQHLDINTMLYRVDGKTWASSVYPLKLHEYLAAGKPVISADIDAVREFNQVVSIAQTPEQWISAIELSLSATSEEALKDRQAVAAENTWEARVTQIMQRINTAAKDSK